MEHDDHEGDEDKKINGESLGRQISSSKAHELSSASSPSVFDRLYGTRTQANVSLNNGGSGRSRREEVQQRKEQKEREEAAALSFKPSLVARTPPRQPIQRTTSAHCTEKRMDKELSLSQNKTGNPKHLNRPNSMGSIAISSPNRKLETKRSSSHACRTGMSKCANGSRSLENIALAHEKDKSTSPKKRVESPRLGGGSPSSSPQKHKLMSTSVYSPPSRKQVLVVGSTNVDLISYVREHPKIGETITGVSFEKKYGGKGANQAVMVAKLCRPSAPSSPNHNVGSHSVGASFLTKVGNDIYGRDYLAYLRAEEGFRSPVGLLRCEDESISTGVALITVNKNGDNTIIIQPGANFEILPHEVSEFIGSQEEVSNVLVCQNEISQKATFQALSDASRLSHILSIFNPAPISKLQDMFELMRLADVICPNEVELAALADKPVSNESEAVTAARVVLEKCLNDRKLVHFMSRERAASANFEVQATVQAQLEANVLEAEALVMRPQVVVVTLGSLGACIVNSSESVMVPAPSGVDVVDTVGAGDCFIGTLAYHLSNGLNIKKAVALAVECASISVTRKGAQTSYPSRNELQFSYETSNSNEVLETLNI